MEFFFSFSFFFFIFSSTRNSSKTMKREILTSQDKYVDDLLKIWFVLMGHNEKL